MVIELVSERMAKLDYVLPKYRLFRGFGILTLGDVCAIIISVIMLIIKGNGIFGWMIAGGILCAVFTGLLFTEYYSIH